MKQHSRRDFLVAGAAAGMAFAVTGARAIEPIARKNSPGARLKLALAAYSFRQVLHLKAKPDKRWTYFDFIEKAAEYGTDGVELTEYYFERPLTADYISKIKHRLHVCGQSLAGTPMSNTFTHPPGELRDAEIKKVKDWLDVSAELGSPAVRIFAGNVPKTPNGEKISEQEARKNVVECIESCCEHAAKRGIFMSLENHGGVVATAEGVLEIIKAVKCPWVGVNLDSGNFQTDDPYGDLAKIAPYAVTVQHKIEIKAKGKPVEPMDHARFVKILRDANYRGFVALEYEGKEDPAENVPKHLAEIRKVL